jgi:hypothetical protein
LLQGPGALNLAMKAIEKNLKKLDKGKTKVGGRQQLEATQKQLENLQLIFADKVQYSGLLMKKGGKKGTKGIDERWFALENVDGDHWVLEYYHPKKFTMLGETTDALWPIFGCLFSRIGSAAAEI